MTKKRRDEIIKDTKFVFLHPDDYSEGSKDVDLTGPEPQNPVSIITELENHDVRMLRQGENPLFHH